MKSVDDFSRGGQVGELAIVDTFTKLIVGEERDYSDRDHLVIRVLPAIDASVRGDDRRALGEYLCALGVQEMINLVARVHAVLAERHGQPSGPPLGELAARAGVSEVERRGISQRRAH
jgi:hypothetical protein